MGRKKKKVVTPSYLASYLGITPAEIGMMMFLIENIPDYYSTGAPYGTAKKIATEGKFWK